MMDAEVMDRAAKRMRFEGTVTFGSPAYAPISSSFAAILSRRRYYAWIFAKVTIIHAELASVLSC